MRLFCFGFGYSAEGLAHHLSARDITIAGTRTSLPDELPLRGLQLAEWQGEKTSTEVQALLQGSTQVLVSIPPDLEGDVDAMGFDRELILTFEDPISADDIEGFVQGGFDTPGDDAA